MHARIVRATRTIDHQHPYIYLPRQFSSGGLFQNYEVAWISEYEGVHVTGEFNQTIQEWRRAQYEARIEFDLELSFLSQEENHAPLIGTWRLSVKAHGRHSHLVVDLTPVES